MINMISKTSMGVLERTWIDVLKNGIGKDRIIRRRVIELCYIFLLGNKTTGREKEGFDLEVFEIMDRLR